MAILKNNVLSGKIGAIVGVDREGLPYLRAAPRKRKKPATEGEKRNNYIFKLVLHWIHPLKDFLRVGFRGYSQRFEGINAAVSQIHREALTRDGYNSFIDPSLVRVSHGNLGLPESISAELHADQQLIFSWDTGVDPTKDPRDRVMLLAYNIEAETAIFTTSGAKRAEGSDRLSLQSAAIGSYHLYVAFVAPDSSRQSASRYVGVCKVESL